MRVLQIELETEAVPDDVQLGRFCTRHVKNSLGLAASLLLASRMVSKPLVGDLRALCCYLEESRPFIARASTAAGGLLRNYLRT